MYFLVIAYIFYFLIYWKWRELYMIEKNINQTKKTLICLQSKII